jgi:uncharacterized damage-inducible protein DinB
MKLPLAMILLSLGAFAQSNPLTDAVKARYQTIKANLIETAEVVPEDAYDFKLTPSQRALGEWIGHTAQGNYSFCATIKGEKPPEAAAQAGHATGKANLVAAIKGAFAYCDSALEGMTDAKALKAVEIGGKPVYPVTGMVALIASDNEHYGNLVGYMRSKGITPPSTARTQKK